MQVAILNLERIENIDVLHKRVFLGFDLERSPPFFSDKRDFKTHPALLLALKRNIDFLLQRKASLFLITYSEVGLDESKLSIAALKDDLAAYMSIEVSFCARPFSKEGEAQLRQHPPGAVMLLENLALSSASKKESKALAAKLKNTAKLYINEARTSNYTENSFLTALSAALPSYPGISLFRCLSFLDSCSGPMLPKATLILGGVKLEKKLNLVEKKLLGNISSLLVGGAIAYCFLHARALPIGASLHEAHLDVKAFQFLEQLGLRQIPCLLPSDHLVSRSVSATGPYKRSRQIKPNWIGLAIGPKSLKEYKKHLSQTKVKNLIWHGPLSRTESPELNQGNLELARYLAKSRLRLFAMGIDTTALIASLQLEDSYHHLEVNSDFVIHFFHSKGNMPGLQALKDS